MRKNLLPNNGVPMFADPVVDLPGKGSIMMDSFYFNSAFELDGQILGVQWHQQTMKTPLGAFVMAEFAVSDGTAHDYSPHATVVRYGKKAGADRDKLRVFSPLGIVEGNEKAFTAKLSDGDCSVDLTFEIQPQVLYNGTMGMIRFLGTDSYEFAYPNMNMSGTIRFRGKEYIVRDQKAWFDRQWSFEPKGDESVVPMGGKKLLSWLWIGMNLTDDGTESVSLWDAYGARGKNSFATIVTADGINTNYLMDITYEDLWTSQKTGNTYPRAVKVAIPEADLFFVCKSLIDNPESVSKMVSGCQDIVSVTGTYRGKELHRVVGMEIVSDLCGEDK